MKKVKVKGSGWVTLYFPDATKDVTNMQVAAFDAEVSNELQGEKDAEEINIRMTIEALLIAESTLFKMRMGLQEQLEKITGEQ